MALAEKQIRIAVIAPTGVEDMELIIPIDIWKRAKFIVDVVVYDVKTTFNLNYSNLKVFSDFSIKSINLIQYDAIYLPGGPGWKSYLSTSAIEKDVTESKLHSSIQRFFADESKWLIALCAAPVALMSILDNPDINITCYNSPDVIRDLKDKWLNQKIVVDKQVITGQNAGCSLDIAFATIEALAGKELATEIAKKLFFEYPGLENYKPLS